VASISGLFSKARKVDPVVYTLMMLMNGLSIRALGESRILWQHVLVLCLFLGFNLLASLSECVRIELESEVSHRVTMPQESPEK